MKITTISKKLIKPVTPTPPNLKNYYLSFMDQNIPNHSAAVVLFYQTKPKNNILLEESLAKILVQFYPLAGRYINDHLIDCSDEGAMFVEAEALDVELKNVENHKLNNLFLDQDSPSDAPNPLLSIQVTHFPSGGMAIGITVSHKVFDGASLGTFIAAWSNATHPDGKVAFTPSFHLPSLLPYKDRGNTDTNPIMICKVTNSVVKRLLFDKVALTRLRSKLSPNHNGKTISRVRVVSTAIAKALIGVDRAKHGKTRDFYILVPVNMRGRTFPPQPRHACGNFGIAALTQCAEASGGEEIGMQELVDQMGDAIEKSIADHAEILSPDRDGRDIIINNMKNYIQHMWNPDKKFIVFTDWSKFGFYEADFGWGKPVWVSIGPAQVTDVVILMSNKEGDGIEAWVYLNQDDVHYFDQHVEINYLQYRI